MSKTCRPPALSPLCQTPAGMSTLDGTCAPAWSAFDEVCSLDDGLDLAYGNAAALETMEGELDHGPVPSEDEVVAPAGDPCRPRVQYIDPRWPDMPSVEQIQIPERVARIGTDYYNAQDQVGNTEEFDTPADVLGERCEQLGGNIQRALDSGQMHPSELHRLEDYDVMEKYAQDFADDEQDMLAVVEGLGTAAYAAAHLVPGFGLMEAALTGRDVTFWDLLDLAPGVGKLGMLGKVGKVAGKVDDVVDGARLVDRAADLGKADKVTKTAFLERRAAQSAGQTGSDSVAQIKSIRRNSERLVDGKTTASTAETAAQVAKTQKNVAAGRHNAAGSNFHKLNQDRVKWAQDRGHLQDVKVDPKIPTPAGSAKTVRKPDYGFYDGQGKLTRMLDIKPNKCSADAYDKTPQFMDLFGSTGQMPAPLYYRLPFTK